LFRLKRTGKQKPFEFEMNNRVALTTHRRNAIVLPPEEATPRRFDYRDHTALLIAHAAVRPFLASDDAVIEESV
jgi:hypothetical protein